MRILAGTAVFVLVMVALIVAPGWSDPVEAVDAPSPCKTTAYRQPGSKNLSGTVSGTRLTISVSGVPLDHETQPTFLGDEGYGDPYREYLVHYQVSYKQNGSYSDWSLDRTPEGVRLDKRRFIIQAKACIWAANPYGPAGSKWHFWSRTETAVVRRSD